MAAIIEKLDIANIRIDLMNILVLMIQYLA